MHNFENMKVWQSAMDLSTDIYQLIDRKFPNKEKYNLSSQLTRAVISIPSNIAEGAGRNTDRAFAQFLSVALGSAYEVQTQLILAYKLGYLTEEDNESLQGKLGEVQKMLFSLINKFSN
jgi:four helix bundle protein